MNEEELKRILAACGINEQLISYRLMSGGYSHTVYDVNDRYILRIATDPKLLARLENEKAIFEKINGLAGVPQLLGFGTLSDNPASRYLLLTKIPGDNAFRQWLKIDAAQQHQLVNDLVAILRQLHALSMESYGIGYYQLQLPDWRGSWLAGHDAYWQRWMPVIRQLPLDDKLQKLFDEAEIFYLAHREALEYSTEPHLLHGDMHLYNVIADTQGRVSGVIDWECAHGGEPDFDLANLVRWAHFPVEIAEEELEADVSTDSFALLVPALLETYTEIQTIPRLYERMMIYQLEHSIHRIEQIGLRREFYHYPRRHLEGWLHENLLADFK